MDKSLRERQNDIYYTASLIEYIARATDNRPADIAKTLGVDGIVAIYELADVYHCLSFEEVCDELVRKYHIQKGDFRASKETADGVFVPKETSVGRNYSDLVIDTSPSPKDYTRQLYDILCSPLSDWMSDYRSSFCCSSLDFMRYQYDKLKARLG